MLRQVCFKALVTENTLLRTHCCPWCFLGLANWETFVADTKCFWTKSEHFLCPGHKICVRNKCCARGQTGKHLCPRLPGPLHGFPRGSVWWPDDNASKFTRTRVTELCFLHWSLYFQLQIVDSEMFLPWIRISPLKNEDDSFGSCTSLIVH